MRDPDAFGLPLELAELAIRHRSWRQCLAQFVRPPRHANLWVERDWLDTYSNRKRYCFGSMRNREAVLLWRRKR